MAAWSAKLTPRELLFTTRVETELGKFTYFSHLAKQIGFTNKHVVLVYWDVTAAVIQWTSAKTCH